MRVLLWVSVVTEDFYVGTDDMLTNSGWLLNSWWVSRIRASKAVSRVGDDESDHPQGLINKSSLNAISLCLPYSPMGLSPAWTFHALPTFKLIGSCLVPTLHKSCTISSIMEFLLWLVSLRCLIVLLLEGWERAVSRPYLSGLTLLGSVPFPCRWLRRARGLKALTFLYVWDYTDYPVFMSEVTVRIFCGWQRPCDNNMWVHEAIVRIFCVWTESTVRVLCEWHKNSKDIMSVSEDKWEYHVNARGHMRVLWECLSHSEYII